jgi:hypothetical protein
MRKITCVAGDDGEVGGQGAGGDEGIVDLHFAAAAFKVGHYGTPAFHDDQIMGENPAAKRGKHRLCVPVGKPLSAGELRQQLDAVKNLADGDGIDIRYVIGQRGKVGDNLGIGLGLNKFRNGTDVV